MAYFSNDTDLTDIARKELFPALVGDVLDKMGLRQQFLPPHIKAVREDMVVIGRAMPVLAADVFVEHSNQPANPVMDKPFGLMLHALDDLKAGEVYICTGGSPSYALWGGLMSTRARRLGAAGCVLNGYSRDTNEILQLGFPTFSYGGYAQDQGPRGKVIDFRTPIEISGIAVSPADMVYGDRDGVLVIPQDAVDEAFSKAIEKARGEKMVRKALENGMGAVDAFEKFGIM
jgi:regulator of RNase E activity RraA